MIVNHSIVNKLYSLPTEICLVLKNFGEYGLIEPLLVTALAVLIDCTNLRDSALN